MFKQIIDELMTNNIYVDADTRGVASVGASFVLITLN
jgi:hypothetical protein